MQFFNLHVHVCKHDISKSHSQRIKGYMPVHLSNLPDKNKDLPEYRVRSMNNLWYYTVDTLLSCCDCRQQLGSVQTDLTVPVQNIAEQLDLRLVLEISGVEDAGRMCDLSLLAHAVFQSV